MHSDAERSPGVGAKVPFGQEIGMWVLSRQKDPAGHATPWFGSRLGIRGWGLGFGGSENTKQQTINPTYLKQKKCEI